MLPGLVDTPMTQNNAPPGIREQDVKRMASLGRMAQPEGGYRYYNMPCAQTLRARGGGYVCNVLAKIVTVRSF